MKKLKKYRLIFVSLFLYCSLQGFQELKEKANIKVITPEGSYTTTGFGTVMSYIPEFNKKDGSIVDWLAVNTGGGSPTQSFKLKGDTDFKYTGTHSSTICDIEEQGKETSDCYNSMPGSGIAYRSSWAFSENDVGNNCIALGMPGNENLAGEGKISFYCLSGNGNFNTTSFYYHIDGSYLKSPSDVKGFGKTLDYIFSPKGEYPELLLIGGRGFAGVLSGERKLKRDSESNTLMFPEKNETPNLRLMPQENIQIEPTYGSIVKAYPIDNKKALVIVGEPQSQDNKGKGLYFFVTKQDASSPDEMEFVYCVKDLNNNFQKFPIALDIYNAKLEEPTLTVTFLASGDNKVYFYKITDLDLTSSPSQCESLDSLQKLTELSCVDGKGVICTDNSLFGTSIEVGNLDDTLLPEIVIGAPGTEVDGKEEAGSVFIFQLSTNEVIDEVIDIEKVIILRDSSPRVKAKLGINLLIAPVNGRNELFVGSDGDNRLLVFLCTGSGDNPPNWDSPYDRNGSLVDPFCRNGDL